MSNHLPDSWARRALGCLVTVQGGNAFKSEDFCEQGIPVIRISNIKSGAVDLTEAVFAKESQSFSKFTAQNGDVLIAMSGATTGKIGRYRIDRPAYINQRVGRFVVKDTKSACIDFIYHLGGAETFQAKLLIDAMGGAQPNISNGAIEALTVDIPPYIEQQKIASILTAVDEVIASTTAQINKLKDLKTGMMQELLTKGIGHTEFKDSPVGRIPKAWDFCRISDVLRIIESGWSPQCEPVPAMTGEWGILKTTAVSWDGFNYRENKKLPENLEPRASIQVNAGDVLITRAGPLERVGVVAHVDTSPKKIMLSDKIIRLVVNNKCNSRFLAMWLSSTYVQNQFSQNVSGMAQSQTNISQEIIKSPLMVLPTIQEQEKIVNALIVILKRIEFVELRLVHVSQTKKALMQELLTGSRRVKI